MGKYLKYSQGFRSCVYMHACCGKKKVANDMISLQKYPVVITSIHAGSKVTDSCNGVNGLSVGDPYMSHSTSEPSSSQQHTDITVLSSNSESGQWYKYDNPIYRDKSRRGNQSQLSIASSASTVKTSVNSEPILNEAIYITVSEQSGSSVGLSDHDRSDSPEHVFDNPIYEQRIVRFNDDLNNIYYS